MQENKYDNDVFFAKYCQMDRSQKGLEGAGDWATLEPMLPDFAQKRVLDLGCGFGWHCRYAAAHGAQAVTGIDLSEHMLAKARQFPTPACVTYRRMPIEEIDFAPASFDVVLSSLVFHYVADFPALCRKIADCLTPGGDFVFSVEHPVFTAQGPQDWAYDEQGRPLYWPVDDYFIEGLRHATFLGEPVVKYHRTLTTYLRTLWQCGFAVADVAEPQPTPAMRETVPGMRDELRRPMMLLVAARKQG